jgi:hypothetical protein
MLKQLYIGLSISLVVSVTALADDKELIPFRVVAVDNPMETLLVPKTTTREQLSDLVTAISCSRRSGKLEEIGVPPTTLGGNGGLYAVMDIYIFKDKEWATLPKLKRWFNAGDGGGDGDTYSSQFGQKVLANYYYNGIKVESERASLGFADENDRPYSRDYKLLTPINSDQCTTTRYIASGSTHSDELAAFLGTVFAKKFELHETNRWMLKTGGYNIEIKSDKLPIADISVAQDRKVISEITVVFNVAYPLGEPEFDFTRQLLEERLSKETTSLAMSFVKEHIEHQIKEKKDPSIPMLFLTSSYPGIRIGRSTVRAGKHGGDRTLIIEKEQNF